MNLSTEQTSYRCRKQTWLPRVKGGRDDLGDWDWHIYTAIYKEKWKCSLLSHVWLFEIPRTVASQAPLSMGVFRQEHWSGVPFPSPGDLPHPGIEPGSPALQADSLSLSHQGEKLLFIIPKRFLMKRRPWLYWVPKFESFYGKELGKSQLFFFFTFYCSFTMYSQVSISQAHSSL